MVLKIGSKMDEENTKIHTKKIKIKRERIWGERECLERIW